MLCVWASFLIKPTRLPPQPSHRCWCNAIPYSVACVAHGPHATALLRAQGPPATSLLREASKDTLLTQETLLQSWQPGQHSHLQTRAVFWDFEGLQLIALSASHHGRKHKPAL